MRHIIQIIYILGFLVYPEIYNSLEISLVVGLIADSASRVYNFADRSR